LEFLASIIPGLDAKDPKAQPAVDVCRPKLVETLDSLSIGG
jgi:hypothetical protein